MRLNMCINLPVHLTGKINKQNNQAIIANRVKGVIEKLNLSSNDFIMNAAKSANMVIPALVRFGIRVASGTRSKRFKHTKKAGSKQPSKSDGSDPDPDTLSAPLKSLFFQTQSANPILQITFFANISVNEVAK